MFLKSRAALSTKLIAVIVVAIVAVAGVAVYAYSTSSSSKSNVTFGLGFVGSWDAPNYYALQQGYFAKQGLNVTFIAGGSGSISTVTEISTGTVDFGIVDPSSLVSTLLSSNITNVRVIMLMFPVNFFGVIYNKADISNLSSLVGKPGAMVNPQTSTATQLFLVTMKANGLNVTADLTYGTSQGVTEPYVATGKADYTVGGAMDLATLQPIASQNGIQLGFFSFASYGVDQLGEAIATNTQMISQHPGIVQKFVTATLQGLLAAIEDPSAASAALEQYQPQLNSSEMLTGWNDLITCCIPGVTSTTNPLTIGYINPQQMQTTVNNVLEGEGITQTYNATQFYSDAYTQAP